MKRTSIITAALAAAFCVAAGQPASSPAGAANIVIATNTRDGSSVFRVSLKIIRVNGDTVDTGNAAVAVGADCNGCQTVAIALEAVLVNGEPSVFTPTNLAIAINVGCDNCETFASAYQDVLQTGGPVHFTATGNRLLADIRQDLHRMRHSDLSVWELQARAQELANTLAYVLDTQLVANGKG
jgi:hypothetical protein